jgi:transposase
MLVLDDTAVSEARLLHTETSGFVAIGQKVERGGRKPDWAQKWYPMSNPSSLETALAGVAQMKDTYLSQASFVTRSRTVSATQSINCCFVDLDCYNLNIIPDDSTVQALLNLADTYGIPRPSYIVRSGCGLYAKWILDRVLPASHLHTWKNAQNTLINLYKAFGADPKARDAARVLRATSTINSKNGAKVEIACNEGTRHNFADLVASLAAVPIATHLGISEKKARTLKIVRAEDVASLEDAASQDLGHLITYSDQNYMPITMGSMNLAGLNWRRFLDMRDLMIRRGGAKRGSRDLFIFWMTTMLAGAGVIHAGNIWQEVESLLVSFPISRDFNPMRDGSLESIKKRIERAGYGEKIIYNGVSYSPLYTPTNDTLINLFEIEPDEEQHLRTIISSEEKRRRQDAKVPGRAQRREDRSKMKSVADELRKSGARTEDIAKELKVGRATVFRWFKEADKKAAAKAQSTSEQLLEAQRKYKEAQELRKRQIELMRERELNLEAAREAQENLKTSIKVTALLDKAKAAAERTCNSVVDSVSSGRKIGTSRSNIGDDDDHQN